MNERLYNLESTAAQIPKAGLVVLRAARRAPLTSDGDWVYEVLLFKVVFVAGNDSHGTFSAQAHSSSPNVFTTMACNATSTSSGALAARASL